MTIENNAFGIMLKDLRETRLHWSQQKLADAVGCSRAHISQLELGTAKPDELEIGQLAQILNLPEDVLRRPAGLMPINEKRLVEIPEDYSQDEYFEILDYVEFIRFRKNKRAP